MTGERRCAVIFFFALAVRIAALGVIGISDSLETAHHEHASIARSLAEGRGFRFNFFGCVEAPVLTSQQAPLVPGLLAICYRIFGVETLSALTAMLCVQIAIGSAMAATMAALGHALTGNERVGAVAGLLAACYPPVAISCLHIQALPWNLFWMSQLLLSCVRLTSDDKTKTRLAVLQFSVAAIAAVHTDPILASVVGVLWLWMSLLSIVKRRRELFKRSLIVAVLILIGVAPWTTRNHAVHGRWILIKDSFWYVFWQGNNPASAGTDKLPVAVADANELRSTLDLNAAAKSATAARRQSQSVDSTLTVKQLRTLENLPTEIERMDQFRNWIVESLRSDPSHYFGMCIKRLRIWFWFDDTNPRSYLWHYRLSYLGLLAMAIPSFSRIWKNRIEWMPVLLAAAALTAVHVSIITSARFRIPLELLLLLPAALSVNRGFEILSEKSATARVPSS